MRNLPDLAIAGFDSVVYMPSHRHSCVEYGSSVLGMVNSMYNSVTNVDACDVFHFLFEGWLSHHHELLFFCRSTLGGLLPFSV